MTKSIVNLMLGKKTANFLPKVAKKFVIAKCLNIIVKKTTKVPFFALTQKGLPKTKNDICIFFVLVLRNYFNFYSLVIQLSGVKYKLSLNSQSIRKFELVPLKHLINYAIYANLVVKKYVILIS